MDATNIIPFPFRELTLVPAGERGNTDDSKPTQVNARLLLNRFIEHREAADFYRRIPDIHGEGQKHLVKALLAYRNEVVHPEPGAPRPQAQYLGLNRRDFRPLPIHRITGPARVAVHVSVRLYLDRFVEHREVQAFLDEQRAVYGWGACTKTLVRALLYYRDAYGDQLGFGEEPVRAKDRV